MAQAQAQNLRSTFRDVRRSVVRIRFEYDLKKKGHEWIVIAGTIVSMNNGSAQIIADPTLFELKKKFWVTFPTDNGGYEEESQGSHNFVIDEGDFRSFSLSPKANNDYVRAVSLETRALKATDLGNAFVFPREKNVTPAGYCGVSIINGSDVGVKFIDAAFHSYAYLGSPVFNKRGHLVGITYSDLGQLAMHTVWRLQSGVLANKNSHYVLDGGNIAMP